MVVPREIAELRLILMNVHTDPKKRARGWKISEIAPWTMTYQERDALKNANMEDGLSDALHGLAGSAAGGGRMFEADTLD